MRILMTADTVGGVWTYALDLAQALAPHGVEISLATMGAAPTPGQQEEAAAIPGLEIFSSDFRLEWMDDPWEDVRAAGPWLLALESIVRPDLVHLNTYVHAALPWRVPVLVVGHSCVLSWWEAVKGEPAPREWDRYAWEVTRGFVAADMVAAPSGALLAELRRHYRFRPRLGSRVLPNARDPRQFSARPKEPLILAAGRLWDEAKNVAALARAAERLPWPVCLAGEAHHPSGWETELHGVRLLGRLSTEELAAWMGRAAIYALPARYEPFGLSALEAGLAGCTLVLGDIPSLREVWGDAALFVSPDDGEALEAAICRLTENRTERERLADRACARALEFTPDRMARGYLEAYGDLMRQEGQEDAEGVEGADRVRDREEASLCAS